MISGANVMDSRIENLKSTTFCGTRLTRRRIADIQKTVELFPALSRHELAATLCSHLGWFTPKARDRLGSCLRMLEQLEAGGIVSLPAKRPGSRTGTGGRRPRHTSRSDPGFRHRVRAEGADAAGTGGCSGGGGR